MSSKWNHRSSNKRTYLLINSQFSREILIHTSKSCFYVCHVRLLTSADPCVEIKGCGLGEFKVLT